MINLEEANLIDVCRNLCIRAYHTLCRPLPQRPPAQRPPPTNVWRLFGFLVFWLFGQSFVFVYVQHAARQTLCQRATPEGLTKFMCEINEIPAYEVLVADGPSWFEKIYQPDKMKQLDWNLTYKMPEHHVRLMLYPSLMRPLVEDLGHYRERWDNFIPIEMQTMSETLGE